MLRVLSNKKYMSKKKHSPEFKLKIALAVLRTQDAATVSRQYSIAPSLVHKWRKLLEDQGHLVFGMNNDKEKGNLKKQVFKLEQMLGKKEVELNLLKNFSDFYLSENGQS